MSTMDETYDLDDISVFDDRDTREPTGSCRICEVDTYTKDDDSGLCFQCWVRRERRRRSTSPSSPTEGLVMHDLNRIDPKAAPDDPHCVHCHCRESMHIFAHGEKAVMLWCPNDTREMFEPYGEADYRADEDDAREDAALARAGQ